MEELKHLLSCASLALERAAANAEMRREIQEARLRDLQEMLTATRRERDEVRAELLKLENSLTEYSMRANTEQHVLSSDQSQFLDRELGSADLDVNNSYSHPASLVYSSPPPVGLANQFCWKSTPTHHFDFDFDIDLHRFPASCSNVYSSNSMELKDQPFCHQNEQQLSLVEWQESEQQQQVESHFVASPPSILGCTWAAMPAPLPETREANLEVIESALPEKGKLLQAVMQAGPLLQTLLLTGPLPRWKHPPPNLDSVDIPRVSLSFCSSNNSLIPIGPLVHRAPNPQSPRPR